MQSRSRRKYSGSTTDRRTLYSIHDAQLHRAPSNVIEPDELTGHKCSSAHDERRPLRSLSMDLLRQPTREEKRIMDRVPEPSFNRDGNDTITSRLARFLHIGSTRRPSLSQTGPTTSRYLPTPHEETKPKRTFSFLRRTRSLRQPFARPSTSGTLRHCTHTRKPSSIAPIPGNASHPPILFEDGVSGNGARAFAAEYNRSTGNRVAVLRSDSRLKKDSESGIDIEAASRPSANAVDTRSGSAQGIVRKDFVTLLPPELSANVLSKLDHHTLISAESVSKAWNKAARSHHVWREVFANSHKGLFSSDRHSTAAACQISGGKGLGRPGPNQDWKRMFKVRKDLEARWQQGKVEASLLKGHVDSVYCVHFDESKIITGSRDRTIRVWDLETKRMIKVLGPPTGLTPREHSSLACSPSQQTRELTDQRISVSSVLPIHDVPAHVSSTTLRTVSPDYHNASVLCLQFDKRILVSGSSDTSCIIWDIPNDYEPIARLRGHTLGVLDVVFDDKYIISCSKDTTLCVWDRAKACQRQAVTPDHRPPTWDASDESFVRRLTGHKGPVNAVQVRGNLVASASGDAAVKLWNLESGLCIREFLGHSRGLACVGFSEDARLLVSGGNDNTIRTWDARTGEQKAVFPGHRELVRTLAIECSSGRLISGSYDNAVKVWDLKNLVEGTLESCSAAAGVGQTLDFPKWHKSWILGIKVDYRRIITTSQDGKCLVLDFGKGLDGIEMLRGES